MSQDIINILSGVLLLAIVICVPMWISLFIEKVQRQNANKASTTKNTLREKYQCEPIGAFDQADKQRGVLSRYLQEYPAGIEVGYLVGYLTIMRPL